MLVFRPVWSYFIILGSVWVDAGGLRGYVMDGGKCILQLRGVRPFLSDKFDIEKHKQYKYLSDYDQKYRFDIAKHLGNVGKRRLTFGKNDTVSVYRCQG